MFEFILIKLIKIDLGSRHWHHKGLAEGFVGVFFIKFDIFDSNQVVFAKNDHVQGRLRVQVAIVDKSFLNLVFGPHKGICLPIRCPDIFAFRNKKFREAAHSI